ncbi:Protein of unknown function [Bacillus cereus]|jgi:hypothetical protein
MNRK